MTTPEYSTITGIHECTTVHPLRRRALHPEPHARVTITVLVNADQRESAMAFHTRFKRGQQITLHARAAQGQAANPMATLPDETLAALKAAYTPSTVVWVGASGWMPQWGNNAGVGDARVIALLDAYEALLQQRISALEAEVARLRAEAQQFCEERDHARRIAHALDDLPIQDDDGHLKLTAVRDIPWRCSSDGWSAEYAPTDMEMDP